MSVWQKQLTSEPGKRLSSVNSFLQLSPLAEGPSLPEQYQQHSNSEPGAGLAGHTPLQIKHSTHPRRTYSGISKSSRTQATSGGTDGKTSPVD